MARAPNVLDDLPDEMRIRLMRESVLSIFGKTQGEAIWKQLEPPLIDKARQPGDAPAPEDNYWKGVWRIYEAE